MRFYERFMATRPRPELRGLRVLVTRPAERADSLLDALREAGAQAWHCPLLQILPLADDDPALRLSRTRIMDLDLYQRVIFISVNAVAQGMALIDQYWPQWPQGVVPYAIGEATAEALAQWELPARYASQRGGSRAMTSEALLGLPELQHLANDKVLIVRGVGGREALAQCLSQRGAKVEYAECYQRQGPALEHGELRSLLVKHQISAVCLNSGETLTNFQQHCSPDLLTNQATLVVPSERVAQLAIDMGYPRVIQAENAGTAATLAALGKIERGQ